MPKYQRKDSILWILIPILFGLFTVIFFFYPGYMSADSVDQLTQGRTGIFNDWHPPVMSWWWGILDRVLPGPGGMLLFHNLLFWAGLGLFVDANFRDYKGWGKSMIILSIGFYMPVFMLLSAIWKDVGLAAAFLFSVSCFTYASQRNSGLIFFGGLVALWYGLVVRLNALPGAFPLFFMAGRIAWDLGIFRLKIFIRRASLGILISSVMIGVLVLSTAGVANRALIKRPSTYPIQQVLIHDLVGISVETKTVSLPLYLDGGRLPTFKEIKKIYTPGTVNHLFWGDDGRIHLVLTNAPALISELALFWKQKVIENPMAYLSHRSKVFMRLYWVSGNRVCYPYQDGTIPNDLGLASSIPPRTLGLFHLADMFSNTFIYRGWIYLVINLVVFLCAGMHLFIRRETSQSILFTATETSASGLLFGLVYFFVAPACDFRFIYWTLLSAILGVGLLAAYFLRKPAVTQ